jgi:hypothetical protein
VPIQYNVRREKRDEIERERERARKINYFPGIYDPSEPASLGGGEHLISPSPSYLA